MLQPLPKIKSELDSELVDVARVFYLLSTTKDTNNKPAIDSYFTDEGRGYLNAVSSINPKLRVVSLEEYNLLMKKYNELNKKFKKKNKNNFINKIINRII